SSATAFFDASIGIFHRRRRIIQRALGNCDRGRDSRGRAMGNAVLKQMAFCFVALTVLFVPADYAPWTTSTSEAMVRPGRFVSVSLASLEIGASERVVGFSFNVTSGRIAQLPDM